MSDFGDEAPKELFDLLEKFLRELRRMFPNRFQERSSEPGENEYVKVPVGTREEAQRVGDFLRENGVESMTTPGGELVCRNVELQQVYDAVDKVVAAESLGDRAEAIRSHDSKDIDATTRQVENVTQAEATKAQSTPVNDYSWKADIGERVAGAAAVATSREGFIMECQERGLDVGYATDGEFLFNLSEGNEWQNIRADTLSKELKKDVTRESFKDEYDLTSSFKEMSRSSDQLAKEDMSPELDHEIPQTPDIGAR